jgi:hypothetical protein
LHSSAARRSKVPMFRYAAAAALTAAAGLLLTACSAGSRPPLVDMKAQEGEKVCFPAPNGAADTPAWNSPVGFALNLYYNASSTPVEVESVTLIDPHNLILHKAIVYEAKREQHQLIQSDGWPAISTNSDPAAWAQRQAVPGAVIGPDASDPGPTGHNAYEVVLDVSARTPAGGYATGQQVTYRQGSAQYTVRSYQGYEISPAGPEGPTRCTALSNAIDVAWPSS